MDTIIYAGWRLSPNVARRHYRHLVEGSEKVVKSVTKRFGLGWREKWRHKNRRMHHGG